MTNIPFLKRLVAQLSAYPTAHPKHTSSGRCARSVHATSHYNNIETVIYVVPVVLVFGVRICRRNITFRSPSSVMKVTKHGKSLALKMTSFSYRAGATQNGWCCFVLPQPALMHTFCPIVLRRETFVLDSDGTVLKRFNSAFDFQSHVTTSLEAIGAV